MYCSHCGKSITENSKFCPFCGELIEVRQNVDELSGLVAKARAGDQNAIGVLYEKTYSQVFYTVKSMIKDDDAIFDIVQDSYIKAFSHLETFAGDTKFLPWVKQIAANTARDWLKRKKPMLFTELNAGGEQDTSPEEQFVDERSEYIPEQVIDQQETARLIREIIEDLPEDQRAVIGMFYYEELSVKQIAAAMGASESAVKSRLMYGRKKIEAKVRELEKKGTKLYGLAPIPFLLLLFRSQKAYAAELPPDGTILQAVLEGTEKARAGTAASKAGAKASATAGTTQAAAGGLGTVKIALIALASAALIGAGVFGVSRLNRANSEAEPPETIPVETVQSASGDEETSDKETLPDTEETETQPEKTQEADPIEQALTQYRMIVEQADTYQYDPYDSAVPTGNYRFALVQMQQGDLVPTLLLEQETTDFLYFMRVFQYDPASETVIQPAESLTEGTAQMGGYRGGLGMMADGNGIRITEASSGTGSMDISRVTLDAGALHTGVEYQGYLTDTVPDGLGFVEIEWHDVGDMTALESWTADTQISAPDETLPGDAPTAEATLPTDGDRIVFYGTIDEYSYDEVVELQGQPDPNSPWTDTSGTYHLIVLDTPQEMGLMGEDGLWSSEVLMINVSNAEGLEPYNGQHLVFSIDPYSTYWPSDTSLPLGQPSTRDVHILN